jgi:2-deoxy-D-gluconate 3-dehydrogenase
VAAQEMAKQLLRHQRPGKIINIGSMTAYQAVWNTSTYAATKAGVVQFTKAFSNELAGRNNSSQLYMPRVGTPNRKCILLGNN